MKLLHDLEVDDYLVACLEISDIDLDEQMMRYPGELAYWNAQTAHAGRRLGVAKLDRDRKRGELTILCRAALEDGRPSSDDADEIIDPKEREKAKRRAAKAPTESMVQAEVDRHPEMYAAEVRVIQAEADYRHAWGSAQAIASKGDMLRSIAARMRVELERDPTVRARYEGRKLAGGG